MSQRSQKVLVARDFAFAYTDRFGGQSCFQILLDGETGLENDIKHSLMLKDIGWYDPDWFIEGGYLVDFDRKLIMLFSWDIEKENEALRAIAIVWSDWSVEIVASSWDFLTYLKKYQIPVPQWAT